MGVPLLERALGWFAQATDRIRVWHGWPLVISIPTLLGHRAVMRERNLHDTEREPSLLQPKKIGDPRDQRQADGSHNDLGCPWMGMAGARFGRNVPIEGTFGETEPRLYQPNPRRISRELLAR
jgi:Animal haem peroxidase